MKIKNIRQGFKIIAIDIWRVLWREIEENEYVCRDLSLTAQSHWIITEKWRIIRNFLFRMNQKFW